MLYTWHNTRRATVVEVEGQRNLDRVLLVDTDTGEVRRAVQPTRVDATGEIESYVERFATIYPISGGARYPRLFHCYGRLV